MNKYTVIKNENIKVLSCEEHIQLGNILSKLNNNNKYWVVNKDEPYAKEVESLIFSKVNDNKTVGDKIRICLNAVDKTEQSIIGGFEKALDELDELIEQSNFIYELTEENEQLEQDALLGKALRYLFASGGFIKDGEGYQSDIYASEETFMQSEYNEQLDKEEHNA